jgi:hypothetical protein
MNYCNDQNYAIRAGSWKINNKVPHVTPQKIMSNRKNGARAHRFRQMGRQVSKVIMIASNSDHFTLFSNFYQVNMNF